MNKKNYALILVFASLTLISGLIFLFDAVDIAFDGAISKWYLVLMMYFAGGAIAIAIIKNAPLYYTISSIFVGIFLSLSFDKPFSEFWALIPICISIGMMISHWLSHGKLKYFHFALIVLILSIILLIGGITHSWKYVVPAELITIGVITIIYVSIKLSKSYNINNTNDDGEDYHVRPTKEINKKED